MTVDELRKLIADLPDDTPVFLRAWTKEAYVYEDDATGKMLTVIEADEGYGERRTTAAEFLVPKEDWEPGEEPDEPQTYDEAVAALEEDGVRALVLSSEAVDDRIARL